MNCNFNVCVFLYRHFSRAERLLENLEIAFKNAQLETSVFVYIDSFNPEIDNKLVKLSKRFSYIEQIIVRKGSFGLKKQVLSAMSDMITKENRYTLFLEDDLLINAHTLNWLEKSISRYQAPIYCAYSEFDSLSDKELARFSSWGYCLSFSIISDFLEFTKSSINLFDYISLVKGGLDLPLQLIAAAKGRNDSWAIHFVRFQIKNRLRSIHPSRSLIGYRGIDNVGTHTLSKYSWVYNSPAEKLILAQNLERTYYLDFKLFLIMSWNMLKRKFYVVFR